MRAGCLRIAIRSVYAGIQSTNGLNTMRPKQDYRISEPLHTIGKGWRTGNPRSKTSKVVVFLLALIAGYASAQSAKPLAQVPEKLKPGADESLAMIVAAKGVQIYECRAKKEQGGDYEWAFVAPEAELFDAVGSRIGKHYAGPTWESNDGSKIAGTVTESAAAPEAGSIAWLLLAAKPVGPAGAFSKFTSVQRVSTAGGVAPKTGCSQSATGTQARINYTADYYFFARK